MQNGSYENRDRANAPVKAYLNYFETHRFGLALSELNNRKDIWMNCNKLPDKKQTIHRMLRSNRKSE